MAFCFFAWCLIGKGKKTCDATLLTTATVLVGKRELQLVKELIRFHAVQTDLHVKHVFVVALRSRPVWIQDTASRKQ